MTQNISKTNGKTYLRFGCCKYLCIFIYRYDERGSLGSESDGSDDSGDENGEQEEKSGLIAADEIKKDTENNEQVNDNLKQEEKEPNAINTN